MSCLYLGPAAEAMVKLDQARQQVSKVTKTGRLYFLKPTLECYTETYKKKTDVLKICFKNILKRLVLLQLALKTKIATKIIYNG